MKLCSACLLGINCRYDGANNLKDNFKEKILELSQKGILIPVCPEQLGGQSTPRPPAEIQGGTGIDVLNGHAKVVESSGVDVTEAYVRGAEEILKIAKLYNIKEALLKQRSPSCGCGKMYDGSFSKKIIVGDGVTTALLKQNNIKVVTEEDLINNILN